MSLVGRHAPDFELEGVCEGEFATFRLQDYRGQWLVLFFYPLDFTFVCPTEIRGFAEREQEFGDLDAHVLAVSIDSKHTHLAWQKADLGPISYPMLSDLTHRVARSYRVLVEDQGVTLRGLFIIDPDGVVQYDVVHSLDVGRSVDEVLRVLQALQTGGLCPLNWAPGQDTLHPA